MKYTVVKVLHRKSKQNKWSRTAEIKPYSTRTRARNTTVNR